MLKRLSLISIIILFLVLFAARFYALGSIPLGLNKDETAIGYNAYSILKTGKDEHGISYPLYFKSFNDYKLPVYIYATAISEKYLGLTPLAVRLPSAIMGMVGIISLYFLIRLLTKRQDLAVLSAVLLGANPWHFFFSRTGFEVNVAVALSVLGSLFFTLAVKHKGVLWLLLLSLLSFGLALYSYNVARIVAPSLLLVLLYLNRSEIRTWSRMTQMVGCLAFLVMLVPFIATFFANSGLSNQNSGVFLTGDATTGKLLEFRSYMTPLPPVIAKLLFNSPLLLFIEFAQNLVKSFSIDFFFTSSPKTVNGIANYGVFYFFEFLTILTGLVVSIKKKDRSLRFFFAWLILCVLLIALTQEVPHPTRSYFQVIPLTVLSAYGAIILFKQALKIPKRQIRFITVAVLIAIPLYSSVSYFSSYFLVFPRQQANVWRSQERQLTATLLASKDSYRRFVIDPATDYAYTSFLFYGKIDPAYYHTQAQYKNDGRLITLAKFENIEFVQPEWSRFNAKPRRNWLYITKIDQLNNRPVLKTYYYPERPVVVSTQGEVVAFPYKEEAYTFVQSPK